MGSLEGRDFGSYVIRSLLGAGGMGAVYRAWDSKLKREVAIKILPDEFALDSERLSRFQREAQILASLSHPRIAAIYDIARTDGVPYLVLELVEGESLSEKLRGGPLPLETSLALAEEIAEALEAAHEKGIVHRDLKPANIRVTPDAHAKVLDFGLAKVTGAAAPVSDTPTAMSLSIPGTILGTAAYMSPEQAKGEEAGPAADVWAFGCVLFEMLSGRPAFAKGTTTETLARIIEGTPDFNALPSRTPVLIRRLLRRCFEKNPRQRLRHIGDALHDIREAAAGPAVDEQSSSPQRRSLWIAAGAIAAALLASWALVTVYWNRDAATAPHVVRFEIPLPLGGSLTSIVPLAVSPDGQQVVYGGGGQPEIRYLAQLRPVRLENLSNLSGPFFSSDGEWLLFTETGLLKRIPANGGPTRTVFDALTNPSFGGTAGPDNMIILALSNGLVRVAADGTAELIIEPKKENGELFLAWPEILPGGEWVMYTIRPQETDRGAQIAARNLRTGETKALFRGGTKAVYLEPGYLLYAAGRNLEARTMDLKTLEVGAEPVSLDIAIHLAPPYDSPVYAASRNGTLAYVSASVENERQLVWVSRDPSVAEETLVTLPQRFNYPRIRPNATEIALDLSGANRDIGVLDLQRPETIRRFTEHPNVDGGPLYSADGRYLFFSSQREGGSFNIYRQNADGTGAPERLFKSSKTQFAHGVTADGLQLLVTSAGDIDILTLETRELKPLLNSAANEMNPALSPGDRYMAYEFGDAGSKEVHVVPFPNVQSNRWRIGSGVQPQWSPDGKELFFVDEKTRDMMTVSVETEKEFRFQPPRMAFSTNAYEYGGLRSYDVARDGRFLLVKGRASVQRESLAIKVVVHWIEELKKRLPPR